MAQKNRTNPNKANRNLLQAAKAADIIISEKIGIRNIIDAEQNTIINLGLDIPDAGGFLLRPDNFHPYYPIRSAYVRHEGKSALLWATPGHIRCVGRPGDPSSLFEANTIADELFRQPKLGNDTYIGSMGSIYGDAVLITDVRQHWSVSPHRLTDQSHADDLCSNLTTAHVMSGRYTTSSGTLSTRSIVFVEEPSAEDLIYLTMALA